MKRMATVLTLALAFTITAQAAHPLSGPRIRVSPTRDHTPTVHDHSAMTHHK
jgi:hypothetical protein